MSDKIKKSPQIRFAGFTDTWEQRKAEEIFKTVSDKGHTELPVLSASQQLGMVRRDENGIDIQYDKKSVVNYKRVLPKQFVIHLRSFQGGFAHSSLEGITSPAYTIIDFKPENNQSDLFWKEIFTSKKFIKNLETVTYGIRDGRSISFNDFKTLLFTLPSYKEQEQIAGFFNDLNNFITLHQRELELLKETKKSLLQKMFPKDGANVPEIRFAGFTDAWEQHRLGEMLEERNEQIPENEEYSLMSFVQGTGVTPKVDRYDRNFLVKDVNKKYKKTELGDFIYSSNNLETGSIGFNKTGKAVISPVYSVFSSKNKMESQFIGILSTRKDFIGKMLRFRQGVVYGQWRIHEKDFLDIQITVPSHDEQKEIIGFFVNLDNLITLHRRELNLIKNLKKSLLQQMFI
ncbi:restriction endonuclease subunit S [Bacillus altitudinis]